MDGGIIKMYDVNEYYKEEYFGDRMSFKEKVYPEISKTIQKMFEPTSVIDVGCGNGVLGGGFNCTYFGIEGSDAGIEATIKRGYDCAKRDLRESFFLATKFDLAVSIEVAEHLEEQYADVFVNTLCGASDTIVLTASSEDGYSHFNVQPKSYWISKFKEKGFVYNGGMTMSLVSELKKVIPSGLSYLYDNLMVFEA